MNSLSRDLTTNMGLHKVLSNTPRWSPMTRAALSTTLLDPLQRPSACNCSKPLGQGASSPARAAGPRRQGNVGMSTNAEVVNSTNRVRSTGSRTSTIGTRPSSCAKAAGPRRQSSASASHANASIHVAPARSKSPATTTGPKTSTTEPLRSNLYAKDAGPRHQRNVNGGSRVKRVAKVRELSSHTLTSERKGKLFPLKERENK